MPVPPKGVIARLAPYESYYWSNEHKEDQPLFPTTLFVVDTEEVEETYEHRQPDAPDVPAHPGVVHPRGGQYGAHISHINPARRAVISNICT